MNGRIYIFDRRLSWLKEIIAFLMIMVLVPSLSFSQAPQSFSYQVVSRNASGVVYANQNISFRLGIWQTDPVSGNNVFTETHSILTDDFGIAHLRVGTGALVSGNFATIDWSAGPYYIKTEMDPAGGSGYAFIRSDQLLSVPYALYANQVENLDGSETKVNAGTLISVTGSGTIASPYVVSSTADGSETKVSAGTNVSVSGSGTAGSPYLISAIPDGSETKFSAGTLINITGSGTAVSPYVVNSTVDGSDAKINAGTNTTVSGSGTVASPYVIGTSSLNGSETKVNAGTNVTLSGSGTSGSPYLVGVSADGSETKINAGTLISISGAGTSGSPYLINSLVNGSETIISSGTGMTVTGIGTVGSPYVINSVPDGSETKINAGTQVIVTGSGTAGSPYVINSTATGPDPGTAFYLFDEFVGGGVRTNATSNLTVNQKQEGIGANGWVFDWFNSSISAAPVFNGNAVTLPHVGVYELSVDGSSSSTSISLPNMFIAQSAGWTLEFLVKQGQTGTSGSPSDFKQRYGLATTFNQIGHPVNGAFFYTEVNGVWQAVCIGGGHTQVTSTGVAQSTSYTKFRITNNSSGGLLTYYINDVQVASYSIRIPSLLLGLGFQIEGVNVSGVKTFYFDYVKMYFPGITR